MQVLESAKIKRYPYLIACKLNIDVEKYGVRLYSTWQ